MITGIISVKGTCNTCMSHIKNQFVNKFPADFQCLSLNDIKPFKSYTAIVEDLAVLSKVHFMAFGKVLLQQRPVETAYPHLHHHERNN